MEKNNLEPTGKSSRISSGPSGRAFVGLILVIVGTAFMLERLDVDVPDWIISWPMILMVIGTYLGAKNSFRPGVWMIMIGLGFLFTAEDILYDFEVRLYLWPVMIIAIGLYLILRPRRGKYGDSTNTTITSEDTIDSTSVFGGTKENIISKNFKGGEVTAIFGGSDLFLSQADIQGTVVIDSTTIFGGIKIVVPPHWNLKSEVVCIFGGIDDKRKTEAVVDMSKTLVLRGTCIFGGIDIKSH